MTQNCMFLFNKKDTKANRTTTDLLHSQLIRINFNPNLCLYVLMNDDAFLASACIKLDIYIMFRKHTLTLNCMSLYFIY